jgi:hypothetical protein
MPTHSRLPERDTKRWRRLEAEARIIALTMDDLESKRVMLFVADGYKRLAERAGERDAKEFIDGTSFGPDALKAIGDAFDAAWAEIASNFAGNLLQTDTARLQLATALLSIASEDTAVTCRCCCCQSVYIVLRPRFQPAEHIGARRQRQIYSGHWQWDRPAATHLP